MPDAMLPNYNANRDPNERSDAPETPSRRRVSSVAIGALGLMMIAAAIGGLPSAVALLGKDADQTHLFNRMIAGALSWGVLGLIGGAGLGLLVDFLIQRRRRE